MKARRQKTGGAVSAELPAAAVGWSGSFWWQMVSGAAVVLLAAAAFSIRPITDSDFWHHVAFGRMFVEEGIFPRSDVLGSTSAGRPWVSSGWLSATLFYLVYAAAPVYGPTLLVIAVVTLTGLLLLSVGGFRTRRPALVVLFVVAALAASHPRFLPRPDLFSQLMLPLLLLALSWLDDVARFTGWRRRLFYSAVPFIFMLWANLHMLFVIGLGVLTIYTAVALWEHRRGTARDIPALLFIWGASLVACLLTPNGWRSAWFVMENARLNDASSRINELKPFFSMIGEPGAAALFTLLTAWFIISIYLTIMARRDGGAAKPWHFAVALLILAVGLSQRRQLGLVVPALTILVLITCPARAADGGHQVPGRRKYQIDTAPDLWTRGSTFLVPALFLMVVYGFLVKARLLPDPAQPTAMVGINCHWFPCEAVSFLQDNPPPDRLFHDLYTGSFLAYQLYPETGVFIDGRLEVYNNGTYDDFFAPPEGRMSVLELFDRYEINSALLDWRDAHRQPASTAAVLSAHADWRLCWFSDNYALFVRETDSTRPYREAHVYRVLNPLMPEPFLAALQDPAARPAALAEARRAVKDNPGSYLAQKAALATQGSP